jgi:predicted CxxxxCH...CXXCH cytochrome family protein
MVAAAVHPFPQTCEATACHSSGAPTAWGDWSIAMATAQLAAVGVGIHNVLIATDFSHHSAAALSYGLEFVHRFSAHADIVYVLPTDEYALLGPEALTAAKEAARRDLLELKTKLRHNEALEENLDYRVSMLEGSVSECLLSWAVEKDIDLIVVGTHGRGGLGKIILGSVAEKVFRHSPIPVLTVGPHVRRTVDLSGRSHILAPCDLSPKSHPAVRYACALAKEHHSQLIIFHVIEHGNEGTKVDPERIKQGITEKLAEIVGHDGDGVSVRYRIEFGKIASTILDTASEIDADLIVLGVRPSAGLFDRFVWPVAYEVVREATCPVLTLRQGYPIR